MNPGDVKNECQAAREHFALLLYGELSFDDEERIESHLDSCDSCRSALERQKRMHAAVDAVEVTPSPALLAGCRRELADRIGRERSVSGWFSRFVSGLNIQVLKPAGAFALVALGFLVASVTPALRFPNQPNTVQEAGLVGFNGSRVRDIEPQADGSVRIVLDETHQRTVAGKLDDQAVRSLLLSAAKEASDPGLRAETVSILVGSADDSDVREALVFSLANDQSAGVRLKAMEGLKRFAADRDVQDALAQMLLSEGNPGLRTEAIDLLTSKQVGAFDRHVVGALQELMDREDNTYVRQRCQRALQAVKASAEIY